MTWQDTTIFCVGISHKTASLSLRERFHLTESKIIPSIAAIRKNFALRELVILSTCNRCELYGTAAGQCDYAALFAAVHEQLGVATPASVLQQNLYTLTQWRAVEHILSVAAGIDSLIIGETQITGQFKRAFALANEAGTCGTVMTQILQTALATAKKIRTHTEIGSRTVSISHAAILLAQKIFTDISAARVLIVGAGEMAGIAARHALKHRVQQLTIVNRSRERVEALNRQLDGVACIDDFSALPAHIAWADVVITATTCREFIIDRLQIEHAQRQRRGQAAALIDISLPRNIDPSCQAMADVYLFDLDDLRQVINQNLNARQQAVTQAEEFVARGIDALRKTSIEREIGTTVADFKNFLHTVVKTQTDQTLAKSLYGSLTAQQKEGINHLADIIVNKIVGQVSMCLKNTPLPREHVLDTLRSLYRHPGQQ